MNNTLIAPSGLSKTIKIEIKIDAKILFNTKL